MRRLAFCARKALIQCANRHPIGALLRTRCAQETLITSDHIDTMMTTTTTTTTSNPFFIFRSTVIAIIDSIKAAAEMTRSTLSRCLHPFISSKTASILKLHSEASDYDSFYHTGLVLDHIEHHEEWENDPSSPYYDHQLLKTRLEHIKQVAKTGDVSALMHLLRGTLIRNYCGITNPHLYTKKYIGTKALIEEYVNEIVSQLCSIFLHSSSKSLSIAQEGSVASDENFRASSGDLGGDRHRLSFASDEPMPMKTGPIRRLSSQSSTFGITSQSKCEFFAECLQAFGRTALFLTGGITLGLHHMGVIKGLSDRAILPKIICGSSVGGALVAAVVCTLSPSELPAFLSDAGAFINFEAFEKIGGSRGSVRRKIFRFLKEGHLLDSNIIQDFVRQNIGDITFAEAYHKTKMILNIIIPGSRRNGPPLLLNYLTSPDVLIWSAACASGTVPGLYDPVSLYVKSSRGDIVTWHPRELFGAVATNDLSSVFMRLSGLFNVNHVILSQIVAYKFPIVDYFIPKTPVPRSAPFVTRFCGFFIGELKHRLYQLEHLHLVPQFISRPLNFMIRGDKLSRSIAVTEISPQIDLTDLPKMLSSLDRALTRYYVLKGEKATWSLHSRLQVMMRIECTLSSLIEQLKLNCPELEPLYETITKASQVEALQQLPYLHDQGRRRTKTLY